MESSSHAVNVGKKNVMKKRSPTSSVAGKNVSSRAQKRVIVRPLFTNGGKIK